MGLELPRTPVLDCRHFRLCSISDVVVARVKELERRTVQKIFCGTKETGWLVVTDFVTMVAARACQASGCRR